MKKYPAQIRYEKSHPVVSFRLNRELKKRLEKVLEGKSFADFVKEGIGVREREKKSLEKARGEGYDDGYDAGYEHAERAFGIHAKCADCGGTLLVQTPGLKKELSRYVEEHEYRHERCVSK